MNRVAITGHCKGIGKALFDKLSEGYVCKGFDILTGYNVTVDQEKILQESLDCDIFINNVYAGGSQIAILEKWHQLHFNQNHIILNISSISVATLYEHYNEKTILQKLKDIKYSTYYNHKFKLNTVSQGINKSGSKCKSVIIMPGNVNTEFYEQNAVLNTSSLLQPADVADTVKLVLNQKTDTKFISFITVDTI